MTGTDSVHAIWATELIGIPQFQSQLGMNDR